MTSHIPGTQNVEADHLSRNISYETKWMLDPAIFKEISERFVQPEVDLMGSFLNIQVYQFVSWKVDPGAIKWNAFHNPWNNIKGYIFPPFSFIVKVPPKVGF